MVITVGVLLLFLKVSRATGIFLEYIYMARWRSRFQPSIELKLRCNVCVSFLLFKHGDYQAGENSPADGEEKLVGFDLVESFQIFSFSVAHLSTDPLDKNGPAQRHTPLLLRLRGGAGVQAIPNSRLLYERKFRHIKSGGDGFHKDWGVPFDVRTDRRRLTHGYNQRADRPQQSRMVKRVWRIKENLAKEFASNTFGTWPSGAVWRLRQDLLVQHKQAMDVGWVIYCIFSVRSSKLYIGQTCSTSYLRYKQHVADAKKEHINNLASSPLHREMVRLGFRSFYIFPLFSFTSRLEFNRLATSYEQLMVNRLQSYVPQGFNVSFSKRNRKRRRKRPMMYRKLQNKQAFVAGAAVAVLGQLPAVAAALPPVQNRVYGSRDYNRRAKYLVRHASDMLILNALLLKLKIQNIYNIRNFLNIHAATLNWNPQHVTSVIDAIKLFLKVRQKQFKKRIKNAANVQPIHIFRVKFESRLLSGLPLRTILMSPAVVSLLPPNFRARFANIRVVRRLAVPLGRTVLNDSRFARSLPVLPPCDAACSCRSVNIKYRSAVQVYGGGVMTGDLSLVEHNELRNLLQFGPKFRTHITKDPLQIVREALYEAATDMALKSGSSLVPFQTWIDSVYSKCRIILQNINSTSGLGCKMDRGATHHLRELHRHFVITLVDKAAGNYAFICKSLYARVLRDEILKPNGAYSIVNDSAQNVLNRQKLVLMAWCLWNPKNDPRGSLGFLKWLPKFHKDGQRFVASSFECSTSPLSLLLSDIFGFFLSALEEKDSFGFQGTQVRRFWVVNSYDGVAEFASRWRAASQDVGLRTGDFATMYTAIPHADLKRMIRLVTEEIFDIGVVELGGQTHDDVFLEWTKAGVKFLSSPRFHRVFHSKARHAISKIVFLAMFDYLVDNIFLSNGDLLIRQIIGIPIGTNAAPNISNVYLYGYESHFIDRLLQQGRVQEAQKFHATFRLIDDTLAFANSILWKQFAEDLTAENGGIYPAALTYGDTSLSARHVNFLGMSIVMGMDGRSAVDVYDKRDDFKFRVQKYPNTLSMIPVSIPYAVFIGQLHRYYIICTNPSEFIHRCCILSQVLMNQGCLKRCLIRLLGNFIFKRGVLRWNVDALQLVKRFSVAVGALGARHL